jgi:hypothetical protein
MAWVYSTRLRCYTGVSADVKPTENISRDTLAYEYDTADVYIYDGALWNLKQSGILAIVSLANQTLTEQKTQAHAVGGVVTFGANIVAIEIYNTSAVSGTFLVNGLSIVVPAGQSFMSVVGGVASPDVTISGATTYIISRYV